jgi:hypothetical protein
MFETVGPVARRWAVRRNMKTALFALLLSLTFCVYTNAQSGPPAICKPCLFYGGDFNSSDPNAEIFANENTIGTGELRTYPAITIPRNHAILLEGILFQTVVEFGEGQRLEQATWEIRTNILDNGGNLIGSGTEPVYMQPTGRNYLGYPEYTVAVKLSQPVELDGGSQYPGTEYWFDLIPQCTNPQNGYCSLTQYFVSNTTEETNGFRAFAQTGGQVVLDWPSRGDDWTLCYESGYNSVQCDRLSFGLMGTVVQ